jgi:hypothetical protein
MEAVFKGETQWMEGVRTERARTMKDRMRTVHQTPNLAPAMNITP